MKGKGHSPLKCFSSIFKAEGHLPVHKSTPRTNESNLMLVLGFNLYLIVSRKAIHKRKYLASRTLIQNLIDKWCGKIIFRTCMIQVTKINAYVDRSLLLINQNGVRNPLCQGNVIDKTDIQQFFYLSLNRGCFSRIHRTQMLSNRFGIG